MNDRDDEVTTDVDPEWIAAIRAETTGTGTGPGESANAPARDDADPDDGAEDWFDTELQWDAEATVGVTSGLLDRIRAEIDTERDETEPAGKDPSNIEPSNVAPPEAPLPPPPIAPSTPSATPTASSPTAPPAAPVAPLAPPAPIGAPLPVTPAEDAVSTTVRWEPRQRLAMSAPIKESAAIVDDSRHTGLDRTKIIIAVIVAVTILLVVWLVSRSGDGDAPPPDGTVPAASTPVTPAPGQGDDTGGGG